MTHAELIDKLGGTGAVAAHLLVEPNVVANWRERGVSWRWRPQMSTWAKTQGIELPENFLAPIPVDYA